MENLPLEIIIKIFSKCQPTDLLRLSEACSDFNRIINETKQLSKNLTLYLRNQNPQIENFSSRNYQKLVVENFTDVLHNPALDALGDHIKNIEIRRWNWSQSGSSFLSIFKKCPNVTSIKFHKILFHYHVEFQESLQFLHPLELHVIESDSRIFQIFQHSKVHRLVYDYVPTGGRFPIPDMIAFLKTQNQLTDLTLSGFLAFFNAGIGRIIFHDSSLSNVKFRLEKLAIKNSPILETRYFRQFLDLHMSTLKYLEIEGTEFWDFTDYVNRCNSIEELKLGKKSRNIELTTFHPRPTITRLTIEGPIDKIFLSNFPNLKFLEVTKLKTEKDKYNEELTCREIEELKIEKVWLGGFFKFPKLKKLHLKNIRVLKFDIFDVNSQIEEVFIEKCDDLDVVETELQIRKRLKNLKIYRHI